MDDSELAIADTNVKDVRKHNQLVDAISALDGKKSNRLTQRSVISNQISEFNFSTSKDKQSKVKLLELVGSLQDKSLQSSLKKQIGHIQCKNDLVSVPIPKHQREKIQRKVAFEKTAQEVSKWVPVVNENRLADQLVFPLEKPHIKVLTSNQIVQTFKPRTPLELEVAALLGQSDHVITDVKDELTPAEKKALAAMDIEEAKERRKELMKHRALLSYQQAKAKRTNKIKSKTFHRKMKKDKRRKEDKVLSEMAKNDPEGFAEKMKLLDKQRVEERMSLKHRGGSKFGQKQKMFAKYDDKAREQVQNMLQLSRDLSKKQEVEIEDDDSEGGVSLDSEDEAKMEESEATLDNNPWMAQQKLKVKSAKNTSFLRPSEVVCENLIVKGETPNESDITDKSGDKIKVDDIEDIFKNFVSNSNKKKSKGNEGKLKSETLKKDTETMEVEIVETDSKVINKEKVQKKSKKLKKLQKVEKPIKEVVDVGGGESGMEEGLSRKRTLEDFTNDSDTEMSPPKKLREGIETNKNKKLSTKKEKVEEAYVDPKKLMQIESKIHHSGEGLDIVDNDSNADSDGDQREMIAEAFADDDVVEEFLAEKEDDISKKTVKDVDLTLPGWGDWGGTNVKSKKKKKFIVKAPKQERRKDQSIGHVIINEDKLKDVASHQVNSLPYPFNNVQQFEASIRTPIGGTWNTPSAVSELVKPKVLTKMGSIINPIDKSKAFKNEKKLEESTETESEKKARQLARKKKFQKLNKGKLSKLAQKKKK